MDDEWSAIEMKKRFAYRARWGPTFPVSNVELAVISASGIAPDSMPSGAMHWAETNEKKSG